MRRALRRRDNAVAIVAPLTVKALDRGCHNSPCAARAAYDCASLGGQAVDHGEAHTGA
jgi:hypothetical protein